MESSVLADYDPKATRWITALSEAAGLLVQGTPDRIGYLRLSEAVVPTIRIELMTSRLQGGCSTS